MHGIGVFPPFPNRTPWRGRDRPFPLGLRRAALQQLIADFDPDESGDWAQEELTPASCLAALQAHGKYEQTQESMQEIVDSFRAYYVSSAVPTQLQLVNLSSLSQLTEVFGATRVEGVMELQDVSQPLQQPRASVGHEGLACTERNKTDRPAGPLHDARSASSDAGFRPGIKRQDLSAR